MCCYISTLLVLGCSSAPVQKDVRGDAFESRQMVQSDSNRAANLAMRENLESLMILLDKFYKRNPASWKKTGAVSLEAARNKVMDAIVKGDSFPYGGLGDLKSVPALSLAMEPAFPGDRAGALIYGIGTMFVELYGGRTELYLIHGLQAQELANAAWNVEVAMWMLASRVDGQGQPLLLSNELSGSNRNLSFEREFGRILGRLELLAKMTDEKYRRSAINYIQGIVGAPLLQFLPLDAVSAAVQ